MLSVDLKSLFAFRAIDFFLSSFLADGFVGLKSQWCTAELGELMALYKKESRGSRILPVVAGREGVSKFCNS